MDRRCKIKMCAYGSCRVEFYGKGTPGAGMQLYCLPHRAVVRKATHKRYRERIKGEIAKRNAAYRARKRLNKADINTIQ